MARRSNDKLRVFIASPGDVTEERDIASYVVGEIRRIIGEWLSTEIEAVRWETHAWPDVGEDTQDVINKEIGEFDILVGIMWRRFGTPTKRAHSGTDEEFQKGYEYFRKYGRPKIMFYFRTTPFYTTDMEELSQFRKVLRFRKELEKLGVLFWQYDTPLAFERNVREHLMRQVFSFAGVPTTSRRPPEPPGGPAPTPVKPPPKPPAGPTTPPCNVFLAYTHSDREGVLKFYEALRIAGMRPWIDVENLLPGQMFHKEIAKAIERADVILAFISRHAVRESPWFAEELAASLGVVQRKSAVLIPVRLEPVELPARLAQFQAIDGFGSCQPV